MRLIGRIKWFDAQKGYGFIEREGEPDVFVHYSALQMEGFRTIEDGAEVEFEIVQGEKGPAASNVMKTSPGSPAKASEESSEGDW